MQDLSEKRTIELYKGKVKVDFYPGRHAYYVDGKRKRGVTTFIGIKDKSRPLIYWATGLYRDFLYKVLEREEVIAPEHIEEGCKQHAVKLKEASNIGSQVHEWVESHIRGEDPEMPEHPNVITGVTSFLEWEQKNGVKYLSVERIVYSRKHDYVGILDLEVMFRDGKRYLVDIKTSNGIYNDYMMQTAGYVKADQEENGSTYEGRWIVRLSKETEEEHDKRMAAKGRDEPYKVFEAVYLDKDRKALNRDYEAFLAAKALFEWNATSEKALKELL